jgi:hypothetical protein
MSDLRYDGREGSTRRLRTRGKGGTHSNEMQINQSCLCAAGLRVIGHFMHMEAIDEDSSHIS